MNPTWQSKCGRVQLWQGDCLEVMPRLAGPVDLILCDLPYGVTACRWDSVIPFEPLWECYKRLIKPRGAVVLTASQPFTSALVMSSPGWFRHRWAWNKVNRPTGYLDANRKPLRIVEDVCVFSPSGDITYNPIMGVGRPFHARGSGKTSIYGNHQARLTANSGTRFPTDLLSIKADRRGTEGRIHPTQKPVALMEYLIRTYTNEGELVLDNTMGSGTTGVACLNTGRRFIGIEKDPGYFATARDRIERELAKDRQLELIA
jgi:site-specific DNA-methyltransferase (adenine-specific)